MCQLPDPSILCKQCMTACHPPTPIDFYFYISPSPVPHEARQKCNMDLTMADNPETPAPVFAFRAFKQAIFGTPKVTDTERKPRRRDLDSSRSNSKDAQSPRRPGIQPRNSSSALASPAKGILVTPGTAGARRKTVSWGQREHVLQAQVSVEENEEEKATPRDIPGHFPTPFTSKQTNEGPIFGAPAPALKRQISSTSSNTLASDHDSLSQRFKRLSTDA